MSGNDERFFQAARPNDVDAAVAALESGASANYVHTYEDAAMRDRIPALHATCKKKNKKLVELLLAHRGTQMLSMIRVPRGVRNMSRVYLGRSRRPGL